MSQLWQLTFPDAQMDRVRLWNQVQKSLDTCILPFGEDGVVYALATAEPSESELDDWLKVTAATSVKVERV